MPDKWVGLPVCAESMQGILALRKTKTRRVVSPAPPAGTVRFQECGIYYRFGWVAVQPDGSFVAAKPGIGYATGWLPPYGRPSQLVYFREPLYKIGDRAHFAADNASAGVAWLWKNSGLPGRFMPRRLARACATISEVRFERLVDISREDALAEGMKCVFDEDACCSIYDTDETQAYGTAAEAYRAWWDLLNYDRGFGWQAALDGKWHGWVSVTSWTDVVIGWEQVQEMLG